MIANRVQSKAEEHPSWRAIALFVASLAFTGSALYLLATA
jgi:hypothetical protein